MKTHSLPVAAASAVFLHSQTIGAGENAAATSDENAKEMKRLLARDGRELVNEALREMPYAEYLQTVHWQRRRRRALEVAGYRCQVCNKQKPLDIHHLSYERLGDEPDEDLMALCKTVGNKIGCHQYEHEEILFVLNARRRNPNLR